MAHIDEAYKTYLSLLDEFKQSKIDTEQDTRMKIIDRMLIDVLGWSRDDIATEPHVDSGYIDYLLSCNGRPKLIIEAKRESKVLIDTLNPKFSNYMLGGTALRSAYEGIQQARKYCYDSGVVYSALTTGSEWIGFQSVRTDGKNPMEGKAFVFPTFDVISDSFSIFYDLFSRNSIQNMIHQARYNSIDGSIQSVYEPLSAVVEKQRYDYVRKNKFAIDMERIFSEFFSSLSDESNREMLRDCFVETRESRETETNMKKIASSLISQIEMVSSEDGMELAEQIRYAVTSHKGEFVLIIGNKGAGKSTFIDRFFQVSLEKSLVKKCVVVRVDVADSNGDLTNIFQWLNERFLNNLLNQLYENGIPSYNDLQGVFFDIYQRWSKGPQLHLYETNKLGFKIKFGDYIQKLIEDQPQMYINALLDNVVKSRGLMPCIIFDNMDHFTQEYQERVFQYAQSIHRRVFSFIICPITDRTIWQLNKEGPFQTYPTKTFYLPIPPAKEILEKRLLFIRNKIEQDDGKGKYFLDKGIKLEISALKSFAACIEHVLINTDFSSRLIGHLTNYDIRRCLELSKQIVTSPHIKLEELVSSFISGESFNVSINDIRKAVYLGGYSVYNYESNSFIWNLLKIEPDKITTPLIKASILKYLLSTKTGPVGEDSYFHVEKIGEYFEMTGISKYITYYYANEMLKKGLVIPYDPAETVIYDEMPIRISYSGRLHLEFVVSDSVYISQMALVTGIREGSVVSSMRDVYRGSMVEWKAINNLFITYCIGQDKGFFTIPEDIAYDPQRSLRNELVARWIK